MEPTSSSNPLLIWALLAVLVSQNLMIPVLSRNFEDQKNYYTPSPRTGGTPRAPHRGHSRGTSPSHGCRPSHGRGGSYNPTPSPPSTGSGGGYYNPPPSSGGGGGYYSPPPSSGSGGGYYSPPPSSGSGGGGGYYGSPPSSGSGGAPPSTPTVTPTIPGFSPPSTPLLPDPNTPIIGTCNFWGTHPGLIWGLLGWWATVGGVFGVAATPANISLQQALSNTYKDGTGALYREGTASLLNSMVNKKFPFTTKQVKDSFVRALASNKAAAAQAKIFKLANERRLKSRT